MTNPSQAQRKAIYLLSAKKQCIESDNQRLIITNEDCAPQPIPFNRISRILSGANAQWQGKSIAACLARDIPIIWLDQSHTPVGDAHPLHREKGEFHQTLLNYLDLSDWRHRYGNWLKSRRMDIISQLRRARILTLSDYERLKREYVHRNTPGNRPQPAIRAACQAIINQQLAQWCCQTRYWGYEGEPLELASDMAELIAYEYHLSHTVPKKTVAEQIQDFEAWWKESKLHLQRHFNDLRKHLAAENEAWQ